MIYQAERRSAPERSGSCNVLADRAGMRGGNDLDLYSGGVRFECRLAH
jgi:hypothetical protein